MYYQRKGFRGIVAGLQPAAVRATAIALATTATLLLIPMSFAQQTPASAAVGVSAQAATNAVPNLIRYSGTLQGEQGAAAPLSATVGATFAIYKQQDGGAPIWMETQNVTADASGQYSVLLGSTKTEGVPAELFSDQEQRWLGVQVQGQPEQARVLLVSVPYALRAHEADTLGGLPASAFAQVSTTQPGVSPTGSPAPVDALAGRANPASVSPDVNVSGSGIAKYIPLWATAHALGDSVIYQFSPTLVGVGTKIPSTQLDVSGAINTSPTTTNTNTGNYQILENPILSIGWPAPISVANNNLFVGYLAGAQGNNGTPPTGTSDTFVGSQAGLHNLSGSNNTAVGTLSGYRNGTGNNNVAVGVDAAFGVLGINTSNNTVVGEDAGANNTASNIAFFGYQAGLNNTGAGNSFVGYQAGAANTTGCQNTFAGSQAGYNNTNGGACFQSNAGGNSFFGTLAGFNNVGGFSDTFIGWQAGMSNVSAAGNTFVGNNAGANMAGVINDGCCNTFVGNGAGLGTASYQAATNTCVGHGSCTSLGSGGNGNVAMGYYAGGATTTGVQNAFFGNTAGNANTTGNYNTYLGWSSGTSVAGSGSSNILIGSMGATGDNNTIRIGTDGTGPAQQVNAYMAGILNTTTIPTGTNYPVCIAYDGSTGDKLFTVSTGCSSSSSRRFKENILDMGDSSSKLFQLRPVTFFYKPQYDDGSHLLHYGLIAEEVAQFFPEMVGYDKDGQPSSVRYQELAPMLLNELQKQNSQIAAQKEQIQAQEQQFGAKVRSLEERLARMEAALEQKTAGAPSR